MLFLILRIGSVAALEQSIGYLICTSITLSPGVESSLALEPTLDGLFELEPTIDADIDLKECE